MKKSEPFLVLLSLAATLMILPWAEHFAPMPRSGGGGGRLEAAEAAKDRSSGDAFHQRCGNCHSHGGNEVRPDLPLLKAPQLKDFDTFLSYLRTPHPRDGSMNIMPPISVDELSDEEARAVYEGILGMSGRD